MSLNWKKIAQILTDKVKPDLTLVKIAMHNPNIDQSVKNSILEAYDYNRAI